MKKQTRTNIIGFSVVGLVIIFIIGINLYSEHKDQLAKNERVAKEKVRKHEEYLLKQEALKIRNAKWDKLDSKGRILFRKSEYKSFADLLISKYPAENDATCYHSGVEIYGSNEGFVRRHMINAFKYEWMNEVIFNKVLVRMFVIVIELPQREDKEINKIFEIFYNENCKK
jgi:hypothetical protein